MAVRELGPAALAVVGAVRSAVVDHETVLVACSGGPDSLTLAAALTHVARRRPLRIAAVCVDHGLQADSAEVAAETVRQLRRLGFDDAQVSTVRVPDDIPGGPEAAARTARYAALDAVADDLGADAVLLGHTRDDQAETVLLGLARGSGTRSLAGMAAVVGRYRRPLLGLDRATVAAACGEWQLSPWSDPHNGVTRYARVRVRNAVLPTMEAELGPGIATALARTADLARADADLLDELAAEADPGTDTLACEVLVTLPTALRTRVLRRWLLRSGAIEPGARHVVAVDGLVLDWHGQGPVQLPGLSVTRSSGVLLVATD